MGSGAIVTGPDPMASMWSLNGLTRQLLQDPLHLLQGNGFYPYSDTLAVLDHQTASAITVAPMALAGASGVLIFNIAMLAAFALNGLFTFLLVRRVTGSFAGGLIAGCGFAFSSYHTYQVGQLHIAATQWIPLALFLLLRYLDRPTWSRWASFTAATLMVALSSWQTAVLGAITIGIVTLWSLLSTPGAIGRRLAGLAAAAAICAVALLPLARVYADVGERWPPRTTDGRETVGTLARNSINIVALITRPTNSRAPYADSWGQPEYRRPGVFPGLVLVALALPALGLLRRRKHAMATRLDAIARAALLVSAAMAVIMLIAAAAGPAGGPVLGWLQRLSPFAVLGLAGLAVAGLAARRRRGGDSLSIAVLTFSVLALTGALLSLGPRVQFSDVDLGSGLWRMDLLPIRLIMRAPARFSLLLALGTAVLAGIGTAELLRRMTRRSAVLLTVTLLVLLNLDLAFRMPTFNEAPAPGAVDQWLAEMPDEGAVIEYPLLDYHWAIYAGQRYGRRTVNGEGYLFPYEYRELEQLDDLGAEQLAMLWEHFHPRFVVVRTELYKRPQRRALMARIEEHRDALRLRRRFGSDYVYELVDRGNDSELYRRWPRRALGDRRSVELEATVCCQRPGTEGVLAIALNDAILLQTSQERPDTSDVLTIPVTDEQLRPGMNVFALWGDYRYTDPEQARPIGETGVRLAADVSIRSDRGRTRVQINGRVFRPDKGYFLVELDAATAAVRRTGQFNVSWFPEASAELADFVRQVPDGAPVVVATEFDVSRDLQASAVAALAELGLATDLRDRFQTQHAAIGVKGASPGTALEVINRWRAVLVLGEPELRRVRVHRFELRP
ncbi:MAG: interleukin-like EMT inducer domain-containing protein [Acidobacteriota bacterium]|jgi:hypothetical protein